LKIFFIIVKQKTICLILEKFAKIFKIKPAQKRQKYKSFSKK